MATTNLPSSSAPAWANPSPMNTSHEEILDDDDSILLQPFSTLDEPVRETIMRDLRAVGSKLRVVLLPLDSRRTIGFSAFGYNTVESSEHVDGQQAQQQQQPQEEQMSENQKKVLERLKDWDLW